MNHSSDKTVSVVLAAYNGEKYIADQLRSILNQTVLPNEIIIIDDHSSDDTLNVIESFFQNESISPLLIKHEKNKGVNRSFEDGINIASSRFIFLCDQDDFWLENKIEKMLNAFDMERNVSMVICNAAITDEDLLPTGKDMFGFTRLDLDFQNGVCSIETKTMQSLLLKRNYVTGMSLAFDKSMLNKLSIPDEVIFDYWLAWNLSERGTTLFLNDELVLYRQHGNNVVGAAKHASFSEYFKKRRKNKETIYNRFCKLESLKLSDPDITASISKAKTFHYERLMLLDETKFQGIKTIFKNSQKGSYSSYTNYARKEIVKDMIDVLLH